MDHDDSRRGRAAVRACWGLGLILGVATALGEAAIDAGGEASRRVGDPGNESTADARFRRMAETEDRIRELTPAIALLSRSVAELQLPDLRSAQVFAEGATATDLTAEKRMSAHGSGARIGLETWEWAPGDEPVPLEGRSQGLWAALWDEVTYFETAKFAVVRGALVGEDRFETALAFSARARAHGSATPVVSLHGGADVGWLRDGDGWRIGSWRSWPMRAQRLPHPMFEEVLRQAIPDPAAYASARRSVHEGYIREVFLTGGTTFHYKKEFWPYVASWDSLDQHPSVAVVDIDGDGWDDFYVTGRWGPNQLWRNRGDGTFEEIAAAVGLALDGMCNCSLFADFDNDGDPDVFIGRSLERGRYLINVGGQFLDRGETHISVPLPYWTSSLAAADYNGDGLLDLFVSTYRLPITKPQNVLANEFLTGDEREEWKRRRAADPPVFRLTGPPNLLLVNLGDGRFARAPEAGPAELWLSSFQSTWSDYDDDGDPDLFVANDYGPDFILRNDPAPGGDGRAFTDVTQELAGDELQGFGMGVTLADYDLDGRQDLFFTYMFSKAGSRITAMFDGLEERMYQGARGNKLLRNTGDRFELVSGERPPALAVTKTGWSWGGQFADLDNDAFPDLYVSNGYYTPPAETETEIDL